MKKIFYNSIAVLLLMSQSACFKETSDDVQRRQQETILAEGTAEIGMPAIKNFRERRIMKDILELRDQANYITYAHLQSEQTGKLCFLGESIGYPIPYATQFTNPEKYDCSNGGCRVLPQADPNGLFSPAAAEGTWLMMKNPKTGKAEVQYFESRIQVLTYRAAARSCVD